MSYDNSCTKLLSLSKDKSVRLWDLGGIVEREMMGKVSTKGSKQLTPSTGRILTITYCKQYNHYATGYENGEIVIWDDRADFVLYKLTDRYNCPITKILYDSKGNLYSTSKDGILRVWDTSKFSSS